MFLSAVLPFSGQFFGSAFYHPRFVLPSRRFALPSLLFDLPSVVVVVVVVVVVT